MKEADIRPKVLFDEYLRLASVDAETYFVNADKIKISCPACSHEGDPSFTKSGFHYEYCSHCFTLYVSPRPQQEAFHRYYEEAPSVKFWATNFYKETESPRRESLWKPKAKQILSILDSHSATHHSVIDVGGGYGLFAEEVIKLGHKSVIVIEPGPLLADACRSRGLKVIEKFLENVDSTDLPESPKAFVSFELFEHLYDPESFFSHLRNQMKSGDLFIFTTLSGMGVDIQVLWEHSRSVYPPHHLNFFNPDSIQLLLKRCGFAVVEIETPGQLDMDILKNNSHLIQDRFWKTLVEKASAEELDAWQKFIVQQKRSSHMRVICKILKD